MYIAPFEKSMKELFAKTVNGLLSRSYVIDTWQIPKYTSGYAAIS